MLVHDHEYSHSGKDHDDKKYTQCLYTTHTVITCHLYRYQYQIGMTILKGLVHCKTLHLPTYYSISLVARLLMKITKLKVFQTEIRNTLQKTFE